MPHPASINSRIILGAITVVIGFMLLTGLTLSKTFYNSAHLALEERLTGQVYLLMADRKLTSTNKNTLSQEVSIKPFDNIYTQGSGFITKADGTIIWQSGENSAQFMPPMPALSSKKLSKEPSQNSLNHKNNIQSPEIYQHGKKIFQQYKVNDRPFIGLSIAIFWDLQNKQDPLIYHISDNLSILNQNIANYQKSLWTNLIIMSIIFLNTLFFMLRWGLKPLRIVEQEIKAVEQGDQELLTQSYPEELTPLTKNINQLIKFERQQQLRYQNALDDLAHSLKTPLAIIKGQNFHTDHPENYTRNINDAVQRMNSIVEYQLQKATIASSLSHIQYLQLAPVAISLIESMKKIYHNKNISFIVEITPDIQFKINEGDLMEILGNLLDNACKWCQSKVSLVMTSEHAKLIILVSDDGPGIAKELTSEITKRGVRADEFTPGHGVGLAIVQDIISVYQGKINFANKKTGGLEVSLHFQL